MSSALRITSRARPLPMRRDSRAIGPPPGTRPAPTSNCDKIAFSRLAKRMSQARASSLPIPVARPRIDAIDTTGARLRRTSISGHGCNPVGPGEKTRQIVKFCKKIQMNQKETFNGTIKNHHLNLLVSFECRDDLVHLRKHLRTEDVERRVVKRDSPILGRAPGQTYLSSPTCCVILIFHGCCLLIIWFHV